MYADKKVGIFWNVFRVFFNCKCEKKWINCYICIIPYKICCSLHIKIPITVHKKILLLHKTYHSHNFIAIQWLKVRGWCNGTVRGMGQQIFFFIYNSKYFYNHLLNEAIVRKSLVKKINWSALA